ncbi:GNAT family N-acetyltransferase [Hephaestia sp. GCM10023244]|uniref:GNAT family N-acetyltransferase n=1 Tax=unclassified Hephaestia TaxID=2631281 RepID=UPI002076EC12|nr:GNAT family N-acetyltransferase [Hephaestia sp. MAHUQ-44]MCM8731383.1 GNAT family N-acetyltransferase [Hephaestia sp. MAHUQ-44]
MAWRVRAAVRDDAAALALVAAATFLDAFAGVLEGADIVAHCGKHNTPAAFAEWIDDPAGAVALVEAIPGGAPLGYMLLTAPDLPIETGPDDIELKRIYTLSRWYGAGMGPALMNQAFDDAADLGKSRILLGVYGGNLRARAFYERHGFVLAGERRFLVGSTWHDDVVYAREV